MKRITKEQYKLLKPYLPVQRGNVKIPNLTLIHAILYIAENGCKWRALPKEFGNWHTIYTRLHRWATQGVLERLFEGLQHHHLIRCKIECVGLDSTSIKVHPDGTGALKKEAVNPSANHAEDGQQKFIWLPRMIDAL